MRFHGYMNPNVHKGEVVRGDTTKRKSNLADKQRIYPTSNQVEWVGRPTFENTLHPFTANIQTIMFRS